MITYSVEIYPRIHDLRKQPHVEWVSLYNLSDLNFSTKREAFKFARSLDMYTWRVFVVVHDSDNRKFGERKLIEVRK